MNHNRTIYAHDEEYTLYRLSEEDKVHYLELYRQINGVNSLLLNADRKDMLWEQILNGEIEIYSIYGVDEAYCGSIEVKHSLSKHPEIGIDLMTDHRNKGIASRAVRMLAEIFATEHEIEYFQIRISSTNLHSRYVFEKMGAELIGEGKEEYYELLSRIKDLMQAGELENIEEKYGKYLDEVGEKEDDEVLVYKLKAFNEEIKSNE